MGKTYFRKPEMCEKAVELMQRPGCTIITYDTETTGLTADDVPIQISASKIVNRNGKFSHEDTFNTYIKPAFPVPKEASDVNNITNEFLADKPEENEVFPAVRKYFAEPDEAIIAGYNVQFDNKMMERMYLRQSGTHFSPVHIIDVMAMAREIVFPTDVKHYTLTNVAALYGITAESMHNSATDVAVTEKLMAMLYLDYIRSYKKAYDAMWVKPDCAIERTHNFVKSRYVDYLYADVSVVEGPNTYRGRIHYNRYHKMIVEDEGNVMEKCNLWHLYDDMGKLAAIVKH